MPKPENLVLHPRDVRFDWSSLPLHWIPGEPFATHTIDVLHLLLPAGERWFVRVFTEALPLIRDERLREDVLGFIGQEAVHASAHDGVLNHFAAKGFDVTAYTGQIDWLFAHVLGDRPGLTGRDREQWLVERLAVVAAIEHLTALLGNWVLNARALDTAGTDPTMLDLLRWHGAEEVEHRCVAWDVAQYLDNGYLRRVRSAAIAFPVLIWLWARGARFLMRQDPELGGRGEARWRDVHRTARRGLLPTWGDLLRSVGRYLRRGYYPAQEGSTAQALAYLAASPAASAAAH